jgi:hypothetical protein
MMTYGWAILIIVIVAVILYSMGIFNPSSAITTTSSGFSPFVIQSAVCTADGLAFSVLAGPISEPVVQINKVYLTSAAGTNSTSVSYTLPKAVTLASGSSTLVVIPGIHCTAVGTKFSSSGSIEYSYSTPAGNEVLNSTGTLAGTTSPAPAKLPSTIEYFIPITVSNKQSSATSQPFQQMVNVTSSSFSPYAAPNFQNVEFFYSNGTVIPSWLENYTGSHALYWLKTESIPASTSITVYMGFAPTSTNLFNNVNTGEAPQLSSTYGAYDNGANVFDFYTRFGGTSLPSGWNGFGSDYSLDYGTNYLTITTTDSGNTYGGIYTTTQIPTIPSIYEFYGNIYTSADYNFVGVLDTSSPSSTPYFNSAYVIQVGSRPDWDIVGDNNGYYYDTGYANQNISQVYGLAIPSSTSAQFYYNYISTPATTSMTSETLSSFVFTGSGGSSLHIYWYRVRAYPPNGVMPSVSFGSVS